jgi:hypothetical protein
MLIGILDTEKVRAIIERGHHAVAVLSAPSQPTDIEIVAIPMTVEVEADIAGRGLEYLAVAGIIDGAPDIQMARPLPEDVAFAVGAAHRRYIEGQRGKETANA